MFKLKFAPNGYMETRPYEDTGLEFTHDCLNVFPFSQDNDRSQGGQRDGTSRYIDEAVNGTNSIQSVDQVQVAFNPRSVEADELLFEDKFDGTDDDPVQQTNGGNDWQEYSSTATLGTAVTALENAVAASSEVILYDTNRAKVNTTAVANNNSRGDWLRKRGSTFLTSSDKQYVIRCKVTIFDGDGEVNDVFYRKGVFIRGNTTDEECVFVGYLRDGTASHLQIVKHDGNVYTTLATTADIAGGAGETAGQHQLEVRVNKQFIEVYWDGVKQTFTTGDTSGGHSFGTTGTTWYDLDGISQISNDAVDKWCGLYFVRERSGGTWADPDDEPFWDNFEFYSAKRVGTLSETRLLAISGGTVKTSTQRDSYDTPTDNGSLTLDSSVLRIATAKMQQNVFITDGLSYKRYAASSHTMEDWTATQGDLPGLATNGGTATTDKPRILVAWGGRLFLSGKADDPHNWWFSAFGRPFNWDFGNHSKYGTAMAVAGNTGGTGISHLGELGDVVTAGVPYSRGKFIIGGESSIALIDGDPGDTSSRMVALSESIGIVGPDAWAHGQSNNVFLMCTDGLRILRPNDFGIDDSNLLSRGRLDKTFTNINRSTHRVILEWDPARQGLWIFIVPFESADTTHYFWDSRTNTFWPIQFPKDQGPTAVAHLNSADTIDRQLVCGGWDSYLRFIDSSVKSDDNEAINSHISLGPIVSGDVEREVRIDAIKPVMSKSSDDVELSVLAGDTAEGALTADPATGYPVTVGAGRGDNIREPARGYALYVKLANSVVDTSWAAEHFGLTMTGAGEARKR